MAGLPCAGTARRADRLVGPPLHPGQHLLIGSVSAALASRGRLHRPTYDPLASHLSLLSGGLQLRARPRAWTGRATTDETSSVAGASGAPGRTCHLRLGHRAGSPPDQTPDRADARLTVDANGPGDDQRL